MESPRSTAWTPSSNWISPQDRARAAGHVNYNLIRNLIGEGFNLDPDRSYADSLMEGLEGILRRDTNYVCPDEIELIDRLTRLQDDGGYKGALVGEYFTRIVVNAHARNGGTNGV